MKRSTVQTVTGIILAFAIGIFLTLILLPSGIQAAKAADGVVSNLNIRVYYLLAEYEVGKHPIIKVWTSRYGQPPPEDNPDTAVSVR